MQPDRKPAAMNGDWGKVTPQQLEAAVDVLRRGGLVAFPTETVYGLGADASKPAAVRRIFEAKGRPAGHPVIVHLPDDSHLERWAASVPPAARWLADAFWPGPLTLILPRAAGVSDAVTGGRDTVGLRVPNQPLASALLKAFGGGLAAPSANRFGQVSPTTAEDVQSDLGDLVDVILDGGPCPVGVESTIVEFAGEAPTILRPGGVAAEALEAVLGRPVDRQASGEARAPGMLSAHYAPRAQVVLVEAEQAAEQAQRFGAEGRRVGVLAPEALPALDPQLALPAAGSPAEYARVLYRRLREADERGLDVLLVVPPEPEGIGLAVRDRLQRAARGRAVDQA